VFNVFVVLVQWSLDGAKKGKPVVCNWKLVCWEIQVKAVLLMLSSFTPGSGDHVFQLLHLWSSVHRTGLYGSKGQRPRICVFCFSVKKLI